ncbi:MAG: AAA family ATPase [Rubrivivax sp.]|nr:AAA family ATPase [Rubrivivax sp.]
MRCTRCGHDNRAQARYCDACGAALPVPDDDAAAPAAARAAELAALDARLARMAGGRGAIVALAGEPGIGKTHTAQALAAHAAGVRVLWGRCCEEPGAPPYWPWLQILRAWLEAHDDDALRAALGTGAAPIAAILPEIGQRLPGLAPPAPTPDAQQQRFRLFDAIAGFFRRAAAAEPLLLIIDNLHWADASSLRLLEFVAPEIDASRILLLATYRDIELSRQHPLAHTLGELARHGHFERLRLAGLDRRQTGALVAQSGGAGLGAALVDAIHRQTEGNPLFIVETTRLLVHEAAAGPPAAGDGARPLRIPEGVKEVIGRRLNRLSPQANRVLAGAALIGRRFELALLERLLEPPLAAGLSEAVAEALQAHVLEPAEPQGTLQFAHALIRETLYDEIPVTTRSRLHLRAAQAIEALHGADERHLPALACHYARCPAATPRVCSRWRAAPPGARRLLAHEEAARYLRLAPGPAPRSAAPRILPPTPACWWLGAPAAGEYLQARETFEQALALAQRRGGRPDGARRARLEAATWAPGLPGQAAAAAAARRARRAGQRRRRSCARGCSARWHARWCSAATRGRRRWCARRRWRWRGAAATCRR